MNAENCKRVCAAARAAGDDMKGKLPPSVLHPERNSYAHVWRSIKEHYGVASYRDCSDDQVEDVLAFIEEIRVEVLSIWGGAFS